MTEVQVEPDASHHFPGLDPLADEDLINYESDAGAHHEDDHGILLEEQPQGEVQSMTATVNATSQPLLAEANDGEITMLPTENTAEYAASNDATGLEAEEVEHTDEILVIEDQEVVAEKHIEHANDAEADQIDFFALEEPGVDTSGDLTKEILESVADAHDDHEIDYDMTEPEAKIASSLDTEPDAAEDLVTVGEDSIQQDSLQADHSLDQQEESTNDPVDEIDLVKDEIAWEDQEAADLVGDDDEARLGKEEAPTQYDEEESGIKEYDAQDEEAETSQHVSNDENSHDDHKEDLGSEHAHAAATEDASADTSVAGMEDQHDYAASHSDMESQEFPAITVQYKGDEYPFFSGAEAGFFSETAVLDGDIKSLLAGFRAELADEIAADEELVFQVDELGLEFAESSMGETISGISLRQILEVFDLLVKNQDPDCTRAPYTFLFTRPSASKRFEYLVESATAGRGLEEVVHYFASATGTRAIVEATSEADDFDEHLESYESGEEMQEVDVENDEVELIEEPFVEDVAAEADTPPYDEDKIDTGDAMDEHEGESVVAGSDHDKDGNEEIPEHNDLSAQDEAAPTADEGGQSLEDVDTTELNGEANEDDAPGLGTDEPAAVSAVNEQVQEGDHDAEFDGINPAADSSTTNTLDNDDTNPPAVDEKVDFNANDEYAKTAPVEDDEFAEIDWRHEADDVVEPLVATPGGGKRPRTDDELDVDDDQDVKRRRS